MEWEFRKHCDAKVCEADAPSRNFTNHSGCYKRPVYARFCFPFIIVDGDENKNINCRVKQILSFEM